MHEEKFWTRVRSMIRAHRTSQGKFAEYIGIPRSTFFRWMKNDIIPDVFTAYNIATALGTSMEYLVAGEDRKSEKQRAEQTNARKTTEAQVKTLVEKLQEEVVKF